MRRILFTFFFIILLVSALKSLAQVPCVTLGQNPGTAFPVCGTNIFSQLTVPPCGGRNIPGACGNAGLTDINPFWYKFTCYTAGTLGFVITPILGSDDYDWQVFDITGRNPNDVYTDASLFVVCNWSQFPGPTGAVPSGVGLVNCAGAVPNTSAMPTLIAGHEYLLLVSNFSNSSQGYSLEFVGGTAVITDPVDTKLLNASANCDGTQITVRFNKGIKCSSISANGSEFVISPTATISSVLAQGCSSGFNSDSVTLTLSAPLPNGNYTVTIANGTDGNSLLDDCDEEIPAGDNVNFSFVAPPPISISAVTPPSYCIQDTTFVTFTDPIQCSSIAADGSDFIITGPSTANVVSAEPVNCSANGETNTVAVIFSSPVLINAGNYQVAVATGGDGNTLQGSCGKIVPAGTSSSFMIAPANPIPMGAVIQPTCSPDKIVISFERSISCFSMTATGSEFQITGPSPVTVISAGAGCNSTTGPTLDITLQLAGPITVGGNYQVQIVNGTDGNTLTDICRYRNVAVGATTSFTVPVAAPVPMDSLVPVVCAAQSLKIIFSDSILCASVAADGSDFLITGPSAVTVASAGPTCNALGLISSIDIQLSFPIVVGGTYQLQLTTGSDGNTLISKCNRATPAGSTLSFTVADTVSAEYQYQVQFDCDSNTITFSHDGQHNVNEWNWTIDGNPVSTAQSFTYVFPAISQSTVQLSVSNGSCSDLFATDIVLNNKVTVDFDLPVSACPEDTVAFVNNSTGPIDTWSWTFGNGSTSDLESPPAQVYPVTGIETQYTVSLTAGNTSGCQMTATKTILVLPSCIVAVPTAFTPNNDGLNDYLYPLNALKAENLDFRIFNRWGQLVFRTNVVGGRWDGRINGITQATGVYIWMLDFIHKDTRQRVSMKGMSTLVR